MRHTALATLGLTLSLVVPAIAGGQATASATTRAATQPGRAPLSLFDGITLSEAQRSALRERMRESRAARAAIIARQQPGVPLSRADRAALEQIAEQHNADVRAVLTAAQVERLDANIAAQRERDREALSSRGGRS